jgi:signal peptide peptidase SppA
METNKDRAIVQYINSKPWAIMPDALDVICEVVADHMAGKNVTLEAPTAKAVGHVDHPDVAVIQIHGTIAKKMYGMQAVSGGKTTADYMGEIQAAIDNPNIAGIVLDIDSPGGTVDGTKELADFVMEAKKSKKIVSYANGTMASAAYWIGSAAHEIVSFDTSMVGSIGVIITHKEISKQEEMKGVKTTIIRAGKYKALAGPFEVLDKASEKYLQDSADYFYTMFVDAVANQRGVSTDIVLEKMAEGRVFIGAQSKEVGLVDHIGNLEDAIILAKGSSKKQGGKKVTIQEAVKEFGVSSLLTHLMDSHGAELPESVVQAYTESQKPVVEIPAELKEMIEALQASVTTLTQEKSDSADALADEIAERVEADLKVDVEAKLSKIGLSKDEVLVGLGCDMEEADFDHVVSTIASLQAKITEVSGELYVESDNATSESNESNEVPTDFDAACNMIAARDGIDIEEAMTKAGLEFPKLAEEYLQGGSE